MITDADAGLFDATVGGWLMGRLPGETAARDDAAGQESPAGLMPVRLDGKTVRGAKDADGNQRHLLAVLAGRTAQSSVIAAQAEVGYKVSMAKEVPGQIDGQPIRHPRPHIMILKRPRGGHAQATPAPRTEND